MKKIKIISLMIFTIFLTSIFLGMTTAKNLVRFDISGRGELDLIKITDDNPVSDLDNSYVVYADSVNLYIYNIETGETDEAYMGGDIVFPKISEKRVVYYDFLYMGFKMYDIETGEKTDLIVTNWPGGDTDDFQFYGDYIVYENTDSGLYDTEIFLYNIATSKNDQLTDTSGEDYSENPCIYENIVAWQLNEGNLADIVMYNIDSEEYTRVTNTYEFESETFPSIYENNIVYSYFYYDKVSGTIMYGLKMYNIATGYETTLFIQEDPTGNSPEIFGNIIAYSEPGISLRLYDLITNDNISIYEGSMLITPWNLNGNYVIFTVLEDGVYLYKYNDPPNQPDINGQASGKPGTAYDYIFNAVDPDGDQVKYVIDWGDGETDTTDLSPSGEDVIVFHTWRNKGDYTIKAHAQDEYGSDGFDATFSVTIPRARALYNFNWMGLLERFPIIYGLLHLLKL